MANQIDGDEQENVPSTTATQMSAVRVLYAYCTEIGGGAVWLRSNVNAIR